MAYRRKTYRRSRGPKRQLMWVRDALTIPTVSPTQRLLIDLLWRLRQPAIAGDDLLRRVPAGTTYLNGLPQYPVQQAAPVTNAFSTKDITGALVKRIRAKVCLECLDHTAVSLIDGYTVGIRTDHTQAADHSLSAADDLSPGTALGANREDWLWWSHYYIDDESPVATTGVPVMGVSEIDTRCTRKIEEWGDTLTLTVQPQMQGATPPNPLVEVHWSILLALP